MPEQLDLNSTFGALLIGIFFSAVVLGVTYTQGFYYFQNYDSDRWIVKLTVIALLIMETMKSAFGVHAIYYYVITNYSNPVALFGAEWSANMTQGISTPIILLVHIFYIRRVYYMSRNNIPLVVLLTVLAFSRFGTSIALTVQFFKLKLLVAAPIIIHLGGASLALSVVIDVITAGSLTFYLHTSRSGVRSTDTLINKLMVYTINNGILTSVFDIIVLAFLTADPKGDYFLVLSIFQVVGNLYTNSLLATLNSRHSLSQTTRPGATGATNPVTLNTFRFAAAVGTSTSESASVEAAEVLRSSEKENKHPLVRIETTPPEQLHAV